MSVKRSVNQHIIINNHVTLTLTHNQCPNNSIKTEDCRRIRTPKMGEVGQWEIQSCKARRQTGSTIVGHKVIVNPLHYEITDVTSISSRYVLWHFPDHPFPEHPFPEQPFWNHLVTWTLTGLQLVLVTSISVELHHAIDVWHQLFVERKM